MWPGRMRQLAIYNYGLTSTQIADHYTAGTETPWDPEVNTDELIRTVASPLRPS